MSGREITGPLLRRELPFEAVPAEVRLLRRAVVRQLTRWGAPVALDEAELLVTELATNVVKHVGEGASASLVIEWRGERLRLEVHDESRVLPSLRDPHCGEECGRGLHLLATVAAAWGIALTAAGKAVWCEVALYGGPACLRIERAVEALEGYRGPGRVMDGGTGKGVGLEESAVELIADLLHWTAARGLDPDDVLDRAQMHYEAEVGAA
ncbi:ATP-binding protein [Streptomyces mangrovisoli]|uniref:ATP-binding protein n=1 Tax=Streptomyces mangrovisoli TaxID=1428628 RepID=A0A1J4NS54_9ACTN|nr:ATP-binding protein [Streptomyces mangrovisoli]OIJ65223.1 ATP-binding protein [Streptomyces mangrovisoli]